MIYDLRTVNLRFNKAIYFLERMFYEDNVCIRIDNTIRIDDKIRFFF